jgi:hypothetical protein
MNTLKVNREELQSKFPELESLGQVIRHFEAEFTKTGQVICQFKINGLDLTEEDEVRFQDLSALEIDDMEINFQTPENLLLGLLDGWLEKTPRLIKEADALSSHIRFKGIDGQFKVLVDLVDDAQLLVDSLFSIDSLFSRFEVVASEKWRTNEATMATAVGQTLNAFQGKDFNLLADVLEYDLSHCLQVWLELMTALRTEVGLSFEIAKSIGGNAEHDTAREEERNSQSSSQGSIE